MAREAQRGYTGLIAVVALAAAPLAAGAVLPHSLATEGGPGLCPFRAATGIPCPLCGATRAFVAAGHGDGSWASFNGWWVLVSAIVALAVLAMLVARRLSWHAPERAAARVASAVRGSPRMAVAAIALTLAPGWAWALVNRSAITG